MVGAKLQVHLLMVDITLLLHTMALLLTLYLYWRATREVRDLKELLRKD